MPSRDALSNVNGVSTAYSLALLTEYHHTLDALPLELSRNFADLRELDAVLSSSMGSITAKIIRLTTLLEQGDAPRKEDRLWLLAEIAEEAQRLKPGGEDKIRVACQAADSLKAQAAHMTALLDAAPSNEFDAAVLSRNTTFPHVAARNFAGIPQGYENTRKRRNNNGIAGQLFSNGTGDQSPNKKKRTNGRDDEDSTYGPIRSPRKDRAGERQRNGTRKRVERGASPAESLLSITSYPTATGSSRLAAHHGAARAGSDASGTTKHARSNNGNYDHETSSSRNGRGYHDHAPAHVNGRGGGASDWLEGPGVPLPRGAPAVDESALANDPEDDPNAAEEADDRAYCICNRKSFGEMIACDDNSCEREWFHLPCIGLSEVPVGTWYCDECKTKRNAARRGGRGGKRKATNRAGPKADK